MNFIPFFIIYLFAITMAAGITETFAIWNGQEFNYKRSGLHWLRWFLLPFVLIGAISASCIISVFGTDPDIKQKDIKYVWKITADTLLGYLEEN